VKVDLAAAELLESIYEESGKVKESEIVMWYCCLFSFVDN